MSDGNFNRQLLPKTELSSGIRAGKAQMRMKAEEAFKKIMEEHLPEIDGEKRKVLINLFINLLKN